ncbi:hypothetical protein ACH5RR_032922 [Cinchona calisaya]|uniref:F-box domain-containing protein n=1 Tax=Cinchona calisaya TaxID=153742 RepID=A0ABD2YN25_9GENT
MRESNIHIPEEIILLILARLPVKTLLRFKSVCKSWQSLISDPKFNFQTKGVEHTIFCCTKGTPRPRGHGDPSVFEDKGQYFYSLDRDDHSIQELPHPLVSRFDSNRIDFIVAYGLCFDESSDDYKAVIVYRSSWRPVLVASLKRGKSWTDINFPYYVALEGNMSNSIGVLANGHLHWIGKEGEDGVVDLIVYFDERTNKFNELPTPDPILSGRKFIYGLGITNGSLFVCADGKSENDLELLIMREYGVKESWTSLYNISGGIQFIIKSIMPVFVKSDEEFLVTKIGSLLACNVKNKSSKGISLQPQQQIRSGPLGYVASLSSVY